jgi:hypothetical protein
MPARFYHGDSDLRISLAGHCQGGDFSVMDADNCHSLMNKADQALYQVMGVAKIGSHCNIDELCEFERVCTAIMGEINCGQGITSPVLAQDVSEDGMSFGCDLLMPMASPCILSFPLPGQGQHFSCKVKVRRIEELGRDRQYRTDVSIVQMQNSERCGILFVFWLILMSKPKTWIRRSLAQASSARVHLGRARDRDPALLLTPHAHPSLPQQS